MLALAIAGVGLTALGVVLAVFYGETARRHRCDTPIEQSRTDPVLGSGDTAGQGTVIS